MVTSLAGRSCLLSWSWTTKESIVAEEDWRILHCHIKQRIQRYYLQNTTNRGTCPQKESSVKEGDVVIVKDEKRPRNIWKLGRVKRLVKGRDGKTRGAVVETVADNQNRLIEISGAVQHLVPVECKEQGTCQQSQPGAEETRTRRQAAIINNIRRRCLR